MRSRIYWLVVVVLLLAGSASAFDGQRKGFVLGGGLGFAPVASWSVDEGWVEADDSKAGVGLHILIGYAWDEHNMIVYEENAVGYSIDSYGDDQMVIQNFDGAVWYHYFGLPGKSAFTATGLGIYSMKVEDYDANDVGFGMLLGGGYEFARHWQFGGYLSFGKTSAGGWDYKHTHINVLITTVAF